MTKLNDLPNPFGYCKDSVETSEPEKKPTEIASIIEKKAWALCTSSFSQIFMALFMFWMMGSSLNIFAIIFTFQFIMTPFKAMLNVSTGLITQ